MSEPPSEFKDVHDRFLRLEAELGLFDLSVDGTPLWERVRFGAGRQVFTNTLDFGTAHSSISFDPSDYFQGIASWAKNWFVRNPFLADEHELLFYGHPRRQQLDDGYWWDIYCDPLYQESEFDYYHVEEPYLNDHARPAKTENLGYLDVIEYTSTLLRKLGLVDVDIPSTTVERIRDAEAAFATEFAVEVDLLGEVRRSLNIRQTTRPLYRRLLRRINPSIAFVVVSYGKEPFIEACQKESVPVVELQHGVINEYHYGYSYPGGREKEMFPDYLFTFGEFWNTAAEFPIPDERVISVGYPHLEQELEKYSEITDRGQLVFISQGTVGEELSKVAVELAENDSFEKDIVYKLHPGEYDRWREAYPWFVDAGLRVIDGSGPSLYRLFAESDAQVGVSSTALFEGLRFDLDTYVFNLPSAEYSIPLIRVGAAELVESVTELALAASNQKVRNIDTGQFFKPSPATEFKNSLQNIIDENITIF
jgi:hypothetical protein